MCNHHHSQFENVSILSARNLCSQPSGLRAHFQPQVTADRLWVWTVVCLATVTQVRPRCGPVRDAIVLWPSRVLANGWAAVCVSFIGDGHWGRCHLGRSCTVPLSTLEDTGFCCWDGLPSPTAVSGRAADYSRAGFPASPSRPPLVLMSGGVTRISLFL